MGDARIEPYPETVGAVFNVHDYHYLGLRVCFGQINNNPYGDWYVWCTDTQDRVGVIVKPGPRFVRGGFLDAAANARDLAEEIKRRG